MTDDVDGEKVEPPDGVMALGVLDDMRPLKALLCEADAWGGGDATCVDTGAGAGGGMLPNPPIGCMAG